MALRFISASERLAEASQKTTIAIAGRYAIGKTTLALQLPPEETLFLDIEAGMKTIESDFGGIHVPVRDWFDLRDVICLVAGPDPASGPADVFSREHYDAKMKEYGGFLDVSRIRYIFVDSISDATQLCGIWSGQQPEAFTKRGDPNPMGRYGLVGRESVRVLKHLQHAAAKTIVYVGKLHLQEDEDTKRSEWRFLTEGRMAAEQLPYIVDTVITYSLFDMTSQGWMHNPEKGEHRAFCCKFPNPWGLPAKNRSATLEMIEEPHLGRLIDKINEPTRRARERLTTLPRAAE
jgi:hypothetical protein